MIKVLYIVSALQRGGPINVIYNIVKYLDRNKFQPIILTLSPEKDNSRIKDFIELDVAIHSINFTPASILTGGIKKFQKIVKEINPEVIHTTGIRGDLLVAYCIDSSITKITSILNYPFEDYVLTYGKTKGYLMAWSTKKALTKFDYPLACSKDVVEKFKIKGVILNFIYNGIDMAVFPQPTFDEIKKNKAELQLNSYNIVFVFVGVLTDRKLPDIAIKAFIQFQIKNPSSCLLVIGDGNLKAECQEMASGYNVHFLGTVADTRKYLMCSNVYIATSKAEGLPTSVLEALGLKIPVVLSNIQPHKEILAFNQNAGELCVVNDIQSTTNAMLKIVAENTELQKQAAYKIISEHLNAEKMSKQYQKYYTTKRAIK